jgi:hypothetical protein
MNSVLQCLEMGKRFAAALDACDYREAAGLLAGGCHYERAGQETIFGPEAICDSYRESDLRARREFDSVTYDSEAEENSSGGVRLTFMDELRLGDATHTFRCSQIVYFDENQKIQRIVLAEIAGQRERLNAFCAAHTSQLS